MELSELTAIAPVDGRYRKQTANLARYFSEYGIIAFRVQVEVEYFIALCELPLPQLKQFNKKLYPELRKIYKEFNEIDAQVVKDIEQTTNHDVKAVEYFLKSKFEELNIKDYGEFIHFGLTSQDINNTAFPMALKQAVEEEFLPIIYMVSNSLQSMGEEWKEVPMLARTHGQPASPTRLGKELMVFHERMDKQLQSLNHCTYPAKFGGATGNFNAHQVAYPDVDWHAFADRFAAETLGLNRNRYTTQIDHYDDLSAVFDNIKRLNTILLDLSRDLWQYISMNYFRQKVQEGEVGSSTMPHKVNPIDFENAEGNLGIANAYLEHLSAKLPVSRLQRDLTDSTVIRNIGMPMAHSFLAAKSLLKGLNKLEINKKHIEEDLNNHWSVVTEGIQTILRREGYPQPYEALKQLTRGHYNINEQAIHQFIDELEVSDKVKKELKTITPQNYTGPMF